MFIDVISVYLKTLPGRDSTLLFRQILYIVSEWVSLVTVTDLTTNYHVFIVAENFLMMALWVIQQSEGSTKF